MLPISVIIPVHNDAPTLAAAVESALAADAGEVVIVNDASSDTTSTIAAGLTFVDNRARYVNSPLPVRGGVCFARNLGIARARHELIVPLDADDTLTRYGLYRLHEATISYDFAYGDWRTVVEKRAMRVTGNVTRGTITKFETYHAPPLIRLPEKNVTQATWIFTKSMWQAVGGYNPTFELGCEDWAFMLSLVEHGGYKGLKIDEVTHTRNERPDGRAARCLARRAAILGLLREHFPKTMGVHDHA